MNVEQAHRELIDKLAERGITDRRVLAAMAEVPRHRFVRHDSLTRAYDDRALAIGEGQTISQPYMVALMTQELGLAGDETVLEIGTGSGYQTAILAKLCRRVISVERLGDLSAQACATLASLGFESVELHVGDGSLGWPEAAPYDGILVTAGAPEMPQEPYRQLKPGGRLVIPIGTSHPQMLQTIIRCDAGPQIHDVCECSFVPLIGEEGWAVVDD